jgi:hypothetical protein
MLSVWLGKRKQWPNKSQHRAGPLSLGDLSGCPRYRQGTDVVLRHLFRCLSESRCVWGWERGGCCGANVLSKLSLRLLRSP